MSAPSTAHVEQPASFEFNPQNLERAKKIIAKYPPGKQQSAVMPLLDLAQRQHDNWLPIAAMEYVAKLLDMAPIRVREVATFWLVHVERDASLAAVVQIEGRTALLLGSGERAVERTHRIAGGHLDLGAFETAVERGGAGTRRIGDTGDLVAKLALPAFSFLALPARLLLRGALLLQLRRRGLHRCLRDLHLP